MDKLDLRYGIGSHWGPRRETPEAIATRLLRMFDLLSSVDSHFSGWEVGRGETGIPVKGLGYQGLVDLVAEGVQKSDLGNAEPQDGYWAYGVTGGPGPGCVFHLHAGSTLVANVPINFVSFDTMPLSDATAPYINLKVFRAIVLAVATAWDASWCSAAPSGLYNLAPATTPPKFRMAWITYLWPPFAAMVTPPARAITERLPGGALLMTATEERFDFENPQHVAVAREIGAALAPINALPWPPEAALGKHG